MPRIVLLNEGPTAGNWGSQAMSFAVKRMLQDAIPDLTLLPISHSWLVKQVRRWSVWPHALFDTDTAFPPFTHSLSRRLSQVVEFYPQIVDDFERAADHWCRGAAGPVAAEFFAVARDADAVVHNGEHQIYRNSREGCRALFLLWLTRTRLHKPSCEINHTAHLTSMIPIMPGMVKRVYPLLDVVTVREPSSLENLRALGITNATLVPDPVFYMDPGDFSSASIAEWKRAMGITGQPYFCLSASALPMSAPQKGLGGETVKLVERLKRIVPQAVLIAKDTSCQFLQEVAKATDSAFFGPEHEFAELWPLLQDASFLVSGHYHYVIMAAMVGCPFVPLTTTTHKMQGVCRQLGWHIADPHDATSLSSEREAILAEAADIATNRDRYAGQLRRRSAELRQETSRNGILIQEALRPSRLPHGGGLRPEREGTLAAR